MFFKMQHCLSHKALLAILASQIPVDRLWWAQRSCFLPNLCADLLSLRITYKDTESTFSELLEKDHEVTIHTKNLQLLMTEMYKTRNGLNPSFMQEIFCDNTTHYNLRNNNEFFQPRVRSVNNGTESVRFKGPQLWQMLPPTIRNSQSLCQFKTKIQSWNGENCACKICRVFIPNLGYLQYIYLGIWFYTIYFWWRVNISSTHFLKWYLYFLFLMLESISLLLLSTFLL